MRSNRSSPSAVVVLSLVVAGLATVAAVVGLVVTGGDAPATVTTVHGETVELYGSGVYRYDSVFKAAANRGSDLVTLVLVVPLVLVALLLRRRDRVRGALLLSGGLAWFLYLYASLALGTAYNELFLLYVAVFGASLYALVLVLLSVDPTDLGGRAGGRAPWRALTGLMLAAGLVTSVVWLVPLVTAASTGEPPDLLDHGSTMVTDVLDLGVIMPATFLTAALLHRRRPVGLLLAAPLLTLMALLLPMIAVQTVFQLDAGVEFTTGEVVGPMGGFLVLAGFATALLVSVLRAVREERPASG